MSTNPTPGQIANQAYRAAMIAARNGMRGEWL